MPFAAIPRLLHHVSRREKSALAFHTRLPAQSRRPVRPAQSLAPPLHVLRRTSPFAGNNSQCCSAGFPYVPAACRAIAGALATPSGSAPATLPIALAPSIKLPGSPKRLSPIHVVLASDETPLLLDSTAPPHRVRSFATSSPAQSGWRPIEDPQGSSGISSPQHAMRSPHGLAGRSFRSTHQRAIAPLPSGSGCLPLTQWPAPKMESRGDNHQDRSTRSPSGAERASSGHLLDSHRFDL